MGLVHTGRLRGRAAVTSTGSQPPDARKPHVRWCGRGDGRNPVTPTRSGAFVDGPSNGLRLVGHRGFGWRCRGFWRPRRRLRPALRRMPRQSRGRENAFTHGAPAHEPTRVRHALTQGNMRPHAEGLDRAEVEALIDHLVGDQTALVSEQAHCAGATTSEPKIARWGYDDRNSRWQRDTSIAAANVYRLRLKRRDGAIRWEFATNRDFETVNGIGGHGGAIDNPGVLAVDNLVIVPSGYGMFGQMPGNVLLVFELNTEAGAPESVGFGAPAANATDGIGLGRGKRRRPPGGGSCGAVGFGAPAANATDGIGLGRGKRRRPPGGGSCGAVGFGAPAANATDGIGLGRGKRRRPPGGGSCGAVGFGAPAANATDGIGLGRGKRRRPPGGGSCGAAGFGAPAAIPTESWGGGGWGQTPSPRGVWRR